MSHRLCLEYCAFSEGMKAGKLSLPKTDEVSNDIEGSEIFSELAMSAGYW